MAEEEIVLYAVKEHPPLTHTHPDPGHSGCGCIRSACLKPKAPLSAIPSPTNLLAEGQAGSLELPVSGSNVFSDLGTHWLC